MKLHVLSDLHEEFGSFKMPAVDRDVLVLAGDLNVGRNGLPFLERACKHGPVVYVLGNHEYYNHDFDEIGKFWTRLGMKNLIVLENGTKVIGNTRFIGATLWTSMDGRDPRTMTVARNEISDYSVIRKGTSALSVGDTIVCFDRSIAFLKNELQKPFPGPTVVVTHHLPSRKSIAPQFEGDPVNGAFASPLDGLILEHQPAAWIHGHTHSSCDYSIGRTRVACNPRGYSDRDNPNFTLDLVINVGN